MPGKEGLLRGKEAVEDGEVLFEFVDVGGLGGGEAFDVEVAVDVGAEGGVNGVFVAVGADVFGLFFAEETGFDGFDFAKVGQVVEVGGEGVHAGDFFGGIVVSFQQEQWNAEGEVSLADVEDGGCVEELAGRKDFGEGDFFCTEVCRVYVGYGGFPRVGGDDFGDEAALGDG